MKLPPKAACSLFLSTPSARRATQACSARSSAGYHFYPRPPRGGRHGLEAKYGDLFPFLSTPSARRATCHRGSRKRWHRISIHALREEGDVRKVRAKSIDNIFLSTPSARRATKSTFNLYGRDIRISIHALREEGDKPIWACTPHERNFYPRPPRGGRPVADDEENLAGLFLSTPSARRATPCRYRPERTYRDFYPRPPRGGRRPSTPAPRIWGRNFYPRPPRGGRRLTAIAFSTSERFLSTPSARRATLHPAECHLLPEISIHALREEGDLDVLPLMLSGVNFYPRPPRGGRPGGQAQHRRLLRISIHALREEGDSGS